MESIPVKYYEMWNMSISTLWGKSPKVKMVCGKCSCSFSRRFKPIDFQNGFPNTLCPCCNTLNSVPITIQ